MKSWQIAAVVIGGLAASYYVRMPDNTAPRLVAAAASQDAPAADKVAINVFNVASGMAGVAIKNVSGARLDTVFMHCTFRNDSGGRIDSVPVMVSDLAAGDTANEIARMPNDIKASKVECLTDYAYN